MGVPKFFRFISERYPCLSEIVKEYELPEFDNFYIDANGIIHNCSHPDDSVHFRITEEEIFKNIFHYLEMLFRLIKPKKLFFIAIDGVAPRAKMNQQRSRRFRTAKDAERAVKEALEKGEALPDTERFDSNCITPGTVFMDKLHKQLQYFIKKKISTEELWQKPRIVLSGHNVPGEGEHKIMEYIRYLRSQSDWDPNQRHCLHGLDADLMMLGLCTHEPHFSLLREEVKFGRQAKRKTSFEETKFFLLHLSLMRSYLDLEFQDLKKVLSFPYDLERIIDDWVLMSFLIGNDFIPNLPNFHIANNSLHILYKTYIQVIPTLGGYINDCGTLNLVRFEKYLEKLAEIDFENFKDFSADLKYFEGKTGKKFPGTEGIELDGLPDEVAELARATEEAVNEPSDLDIDGGFEDIESSDEDSDLREEFRMYKADFYRNKLEYDRVDSGVLMDQAKCYVRAIQWNLSYYYTGCPSWSWYYPHHYSPYVSDIKGFSTLDFSFGPSKPFHPFEQLLAVLPAASKSLVPEPYRDLMTSPDSPIINFYPSDFETDLNGKTQDWEAVVLIPFIDENSLLSAMEPLNQQLSEYENYRNSTKPMEIYQYSKESFGRCDAPEYFKPIVNNHAALTEIWRKDIALEPGQAVIGRLPGAISGAYIGFPHLSGISFTAQLRSAKVKVFDHPSRGDNMILTLPYQEYTEEEIDQITHDLMGKEVFVDWPHIQRGKVMGINTVNSQYKLISGQIKKFTEKDMTFALHSVDLARKNKMTRGVDLTKVDMVVYVKTVGGLRYKYENGSATLDYEWSKSTMPFPYQTLLKEAPLLDKGDEVGLKKSLTDIFYVGKEVVSIDPENYYGAFGRVTGVTSLGNVDVELEHTVDIDVSSLVNETTDLFGQTNYYPGHTASQRLGLSSFLFSRVTGSIFIQNVENDEKANVGLSLKFSKQGEELIGYTRKEGTLWLYSSNTISLVDQYMEAFPDLFEFLEKNSGDDIFFTKDVFPENGKEKVAEIKKWLKAQPHVHAERRSVGAKLLSNEVIKQLEKRIISFDPTKVLKVEKITFNPEKLFIPTDYMGKSPPDNTIKTSLLDRVTSIRKNHNIPLGLKGTVIGFDKPTSAEDTLYDILFDEPIPGGRNLSCNDARIYRITAQAFVNVTQGRRAFQDKQPFKATKKRMEFYSNNRDDNCLPGSSDAQNLQKIGNYKVKQFFLNSGKVTSPQQTKVFVPSNNEPRVGADSEFQAMWNVLQNRPPPPEEISLRPKSKPEEILSPVDNAVKEQTNALRKLLKLKDSAPSPDQQPQKPVVELRPQRPPFNPQPAIVKNSNPHPANVNTILHPINQGSFRIRYPAKACGHVSCCSDLMQICASKGIAYPLFAYNRIQSSGEVLCTVTFFSEYGNVVGDAFRTDEEAAENAACKAIRLIMQQDEKRWSLLSSPGVGYRAPFPGGVRHTPPHTAPVPRTPTVQSLGQLPSPPTKWCQTSGWPITRTPVSKRPNSKAPTPLNTTSQGRHNPNPPVKADPPGDRSAVAMGQRGQGAVRAEGPVARQEESRDHQHSQNSRRARRPPRTRLAANFSVPLHPPPT